MTLRSTDPRQVSLKGCGLLRFAFCLPSTAISSEERSKNIRDEMPFVWGYAEGDGVVGVTCKISDHPRTLLSQ